MNHIEKSPDIKFSQNEISNKKLIERLVGQSGIKEGDLVYDIGAGSGNISEALLKKGARVIAIEKDERLYRECKEKFIGEDRFELYLDDFLISEIPPDRKYKVFSNIPFFHTADIVNKLLFGGSPPEDCYLIVQKEAAEKYTGFPAETLASLLIKPLFWVDILYRFKQEDFHPAPSVDIVLIQFEKRMSPLIPGGYYNLYRDFIHYFREEKSGTIKKSLKELFTYPQIKRMCRALNFSYRSHPAGLNYVQYLGIFQYYLDYNRKHTSLVQGTEEKVLERQHGRIKVHRTRKRRK